MPQMLRCPACGYRFVPDPDDSRRRLPCPDCGAPLSIRGDAETAVGPKAAGGGRSLFVTLLLIGLVGLSCFGVLGAIGYWWMQPTAFPEPTQDYADARQSFATTLLVRGPAPQTWERETPPAGVAEVEYTSGDLTLKAWVNRPPAGQPLKPAVLFLHGGWSFAQEDWDQCKPFRDAGFVTMTPWLRGENGLPGSFSMFYDEVEDVLAAAEVLAKTPGVDPNRIFIAGHSAGGTLALLGAMASKRFKACASFSGVTDLGAFLREHEDEAPFDPTNLTELAMRSPLAYYQSFKCPARLYWGNHEEWAEYKFPTQSLATKAKAVGSDVEAIKVPGNHMTAVTPAMRQAITFFQQHK